MYICQDSTGTVCVNLISFQLVILFMELLEMYKYRIKLGWLKYKMFRNGEILCLVNSE